MTLRDKLVSIHGLEVLQAIAENNLALIRHQIEALKLVEPTDAPKESP